MTKITAQLIGKNILKQRDHLFDGYGDDYYNDYAVWNIATRNRIAGYLNALTDYNLIDDKICAEVWVWYEWNGKFLRKVKDDHGNWDWVKP